MTAHLRQPRPRRSLAKAESMLTLADAFRDVLRGHTERHGVAATIQLLADSVNSGPAPRRSARRRAVTGRSRQPQVTS